MEAAAHAATSTSRKFLFEVLADDFCHLKH
jgi:hypothetical protein